MRKVLFLYDCAIKSISVAKIPSEFEDMIFLQYITKIHCGVNCGGEA